MNRRRRLRYGTTTTSGADPQSSREVIPRDARAEVAWAARVSPTPVLIGTPASVTRLRHPPPSNLSYPTARAAAASLDGFFRIRFRLCVVRERVRVRVEGSVDSWGHASASPKVVCRFCHATSATLTQRSYCPILASARSTSQFSDSRRGAWGACVCSRMSCLGPTQV